MYINQFSELHLLKKEQATLVKLCEAQDLFDLPREDGSISHPTLFTQTQTLQKTVTFFLAYSYVLCFCNALLLLKPPFHIFLLSYYLYNS